MIRALPPVVVIMEFVGVSWERRVEFGRAIVVILWFDWERWKARVLPMLPVPRMAMERGFSWGDD